MLLNGGTLDGVRILQAKTVQQMTTNALSPNVTFAGEVGKYVGPQVGTSWGLGFAVRTDTGLAPYAGSTGDFHCGGAGGTAFWVDPKEKMFVVYMMQSPSKRAPYRILLRDMVYASIME